MYKIFDLKTSKRQELIVITETVGEIISENDVESGHVILFCPHTTAGLTVNSYLDPATAADLIHEIDRVVPTRTDFNHIFDTPSDAAGHIKASIIGGQITLIVDKGKLQLGRSQGIFFWEFDGPRPRQVYVKIIQDR